MKKIITLLTLFIATASFAQLKVTDVKDTGVLIGEFKQMGKSYAKLQKESGLCILTYRDEKFEAIDNYKLFIFKEADLDAVYNLFANFEGIEKGQQKKVELENGHVLDITYGKTLGKMYAEVYHTDKAGIMGKMRWMNEKQLKQLFGKK